MIKGCLFDLDGTLLNTLTTIAYHANNTLKKYGLPTYEVDDYRRFVGYGARILVERTLRGVHADMSILEQFLVDYVDAYDSEPFVLTEPYAGIPEMLAELHAGGCRLAILSNKPTSSVRLLAEKFFTVPFTHIEGAPEDKNHLKPSPFCANQIIAEWGIQKDECFFLGDSVVDVQLAQNAEIPYGFAALWGFNPKQDLLLAGGIPAECPRVVLDYFHMSDDERRGKISK